MKHRNIKSFSSKKYIVIITLSFILLCILSILIEVLDIPHLLLRAPSTPINRNEIIIEIFFLFLVWLITAFILRKFESKCKQAEVALCKEEKRFRTIFENTTIGMYSTSPDGRILMANPAMVRMLGYSSFKKLARRNLKDKGFLPVYPRSVFKQRIESAGKVIGLDSVWTKHDGTTLFIRENASAIRDDNGNVLYYEGTAEDITERKQAEKKLRESKERLSLTLESAGLGLWDQNFKTNKIIRNERWAEMLGYELKDIESNIKCWKNLIHPDDINQVEDVIKDHELGKTESIKIEHRMKTKTGDWKWILNWGKIIDRDKDGSPIRALGTHLDITGRKQAEEKLHRLSKDREEIFQALGNATIIIDPEFNIVDVNRFTIEATGKSKDELMGKKCYEIFHGTKQPPQGCPAKQIITSAHYVPIEKEMPALGGTFLVSCTPVLNDQGNFVKIIHSLTNITGRKQAEEELKKHRDHLEKLVKERTKQLKESNAGLEAFAYTVSHDLRAPLRAMYGLAQALNEDYANKLDAEGKEYAQRIVNSSEYMDTMIRDLLEYSRLSIIELELKPVQLEQSIKQSMKQIKLEIKQSNAEINIKTPLPEVIGHYSVINQILTNILSNTIKFVKSGVKPKVKIWAEEKNGWIYLYVKDNGIGIAPENQEKIFNVFERLHGIETYPGTGIGLAIVKKGMERMGGKVDVESEIGKGSIFTIKLKKIL
ncbi:MAG: PAS domain S-box protein [Bacteroidales bacterium]|nr:PAS domain S-box protein [Bacteroidales bacterium]